MSKSSTASASKNLPQLSQKSAWSRGPPQSTSAASTPRSQSPAPNATPPTSATHSRRPSTLGQGVSFKDGVGSVRSPTNPVKPNSAVTFGSINDASAPISSSPASVPPIKTEGVKSFGTVPATPTTATPVNGKASASSSVSKAASTSSSSSAAPPTKPKFDVKKLFQGSSSSTPDVTSPPSRPAPLPQTPSQTHAQPHPPPSSSQFGQNYSSFTPNGPYRPPQNGTNGGPPGPPRSPVAFHRQATNPPGGSHLNGRPPPGAQAGPQMAPGISSPRLAPAAAHPVHPAQPQTMPPGQWPYYPPMDPAAAYYPPYYWMPPQGSPGIPPTHPGMPISSPRNPQQQLHPPGTPTMSPAVTAPGHPPHSTPSPHIHTSNLSTVASPPATPSSSGPGTGSRIMRSEAPTFVPGKRTSGVIIKDDHGQEVQIEKLKESAKKSNIVVPPSPASPARPSVRLETPESRQRRLELEERRRENEEKAAKAKKEAEEKERKQREENERKKREDEERKQRELKEAEERKKKEDEEKKRKEEEEKERIRKEEEEKERLRKEAEEKERLRKEEEERERARKEAEEKERARKEAEEKEKAAKERAVADSKPEPIPEAEEGELEEGEVKEKEKPKEKPAAPLRIDTAISNTHTRPRPGPLDLSGAKGHIPAPLPSALSTARAIEDLQSVTYPEGVKSPKIELNQNAKDGKFRYDRDFLLQFMKVCVEKPDNLPDLDVLGLQPQEHYPITRTASGRRPNSVNIPSRSASVGLGIGFGGGKPGSGSSFNMGNFATPGNKMTSEERFQASRSTSMSGGQAGLPFGRPQPMVRSSSQGGPGGGPMGQRTRSSRGGKRGEKNNANQNSQLAQQQQAANIPPLEPVAPLEVSANRWQPASVAKKPSAQVEEHSPEIVDRKVKGLLNKLTMEKFDSISDQIIQWANKSEAEKDGRTLIQVIKLVFEKATDEATWSEMYARLCRKMMEKISQKVQDDGIRNPEGKPIAGGQLFRKYLLNRCQEDFERGWVAKEATAAAAATKATEDKAAKAAAENSKEDESALYSDEYYAAQKAKRQDLGLVKFIGELFKFRMLTERIMHECIKKLLSNVDHPEAAELESLCKLMTTVGQLLDTPKAKAHMDVYFTRMKELTRSQHVNSRMQFMLQDVIELRDRKWVPRNQVAALTTIAAVHEAAAKEKAVVEKDAYQRTISISRGGSRRGGNREDQQVGPDGWTTAGSAAPSRPARAGDLSNFGKIQKTQSMTFGPSSVFTKKDNSGKSSRESTSRTRLSNMYAMLSQSHELPFLLTEVLKDEPETENTETFADSATSSKVTHDSVNTWRKAGTATPFSEADAMTRIAEDLRGFFGILDDVEIYFAKLPIEHRPLLVHKLVSNAIELQEADAQLVASLFSRAASKNFCSPAMFEEGFKPTAEILDDVVLDAPKALQLFAIMFKGAGLNRDGNRRSRIMEKSQFNKEKLLALLSS